MNLSKSKIFLILCLSFIVGVFAGRYVNYTIMAILAMIFVIVATVGQKKIFFIFAIAGVCFLLGAFRFQSDFRQNDLKEIYGEKVSGSGIILNEPDVRSDKTYLTLGKLMIGEREYKSKVLLTVGRFPEYEYGQKLDFDGKITEPKDYEDFSYKNYLSRFGIDGLVYYPEVSNVENGFGNPVKHNLFKFKQSFVSRLSEILPEPQNSFLAGLLVGMRRTIPQGLSDALSKTGTTHIIAISGFNITIIATAVNSLLLFFFRRRISFVIALAAIILFVILSGASASAIRAGIMGTLAMLALNLGRVNSINNALALTAAGMVLINPQILHFDVGFHLSFLALMGIVYLGPIIQERLFIPDWIGFYLIPSVSAYLATLPVLLFNFGTLSLISIPVNLLVLPMVPIAMLFGFAAGSLALVWEIAALPFAWLAWAALTYVLKIVESAARIPFAAASFHISVFWVILYYIVLIGLVILWKHRQNSFSNI